MSRKTRTKDLRRSWKQGHAELTDPVPRIAGPCEVTLFDSVAQSSPSAQSPNVKFRGTPITVEDAKKEPCLSGSLPNVACFAGLGESTGCASLYA